MKRIPADIDQLMWTLAEEGTESAVRQFQIRYPEYSKELDSRRNAIGGLRGARPHQPTTTPRFKRTETASKPPVDRKFQTIAFAMGIAAVAAASFTAVYMSAPRSSAKTELVKTDVKPEPVVTGYEDAPKLNRPVFVEPPVEPDPPAPKLDDTPRYLKPQTVAIRRARLSTALQTIAVQGGLELVIGPGLVDPEVDVDYSGMNTIQILQDMGQQYAFTPFDQGNGSVIIVPAVENPVETGGRSTVEATSGN